MIHLLTKITTFARTLPLSQNHNFNLPTNPPTHLPTYLSIYLPSYHPTYLATYLPAYLPHAYLPTYLPTYLPSYLPLPTTTHDLPLLWPTLLFEPRHTCHLLWSPKAYFGPSKQYPTSMFFST